MRLKTIIFALSAFAAMTGLSAQAANKDLVVNGGFEDTTNGNGQFDYNTHLTGWTSTGYNFVFAPGTADTTGANGQYDNLQLWGPGNGAANGLTSSANGGNFVAGDGAYLTQTVSQQINNLVIGQKYNVSFEWAAAQQKGYDGLNTEQWIVSLGNEKHPTTIYQNSSHGFSGWMKETMTFTATGVSETLSFLAQGTPNGVPPFSLLDGVSMVSAVPEPGTWGMMAGGLGLIGFMTRRRRKGMAAA